MKKLPKKGFVFWPVGNGDSTTIVVKENTTTRFIPEMISTDSCGKQPEQKCS